MPRETVLVTGATGTQGNAVVRRLVADGRDVRALVRDTGTERARTLERAGARPVRGDLDEPATLRAALDGASGVFATSPAVFGPDGWDQVREFERGRALIDAAVDAGTAQVVFSSIATTSGRPLPGSDGKRRIEAYGAASRLRWTVLRPVRFMENYLMRRGPMDGIRAGVHRHLFPERMRMRVVAVADIADVAAAAFDDPARFDAMTLEMAGDALTPVRAAALIARASGRPVRYERVGREEADALGEQIGATWRLLEDGHNWRADPATLRRLHPGARTLATWLDEYGAAAIAAAPRE